jgi:hypothetical protein
MAEQNFSPVCVAIPDQVTGTSSSARVSYGLALHHFGGVLDVLELYRGATVVKP